MRMPDPRRVPPVRRPGSAPAEGRRILGLHPGRGNAPRRAARPGQDRSAGCGPASCRWSRRARAGRYVTYEPLHRRHHEVRRLRRGRQRSPRTPRGDLVGRDHRLALRSAAGAARSAWASADMARPCHLPFGTFPVSLAAGMDLRRARPHLGHRARPASRWRARTSCGAAPCPGSPSDCLPAPPVHYSGRTPRRHMTDGSS